MQRILIFSNEVLTRLDLIRMSLILYKFSRYHQFSMLPGGVDGSRAALRRRCQRNEPRRLTMIMEAPVTSEARSVITQDPDIEDLVPSEVLRRQSANEPASAPSFPKVLRRRLDRFFADRNISPKADRTMWIKIAAGLAGLVGSWIALYTLRPDSWRFVAIYLLGGLAQTFLLLNIAHDSNHNAISSVPSVNKLLNYVFDVCGINSYMRREAKDAASGQCVVFPVEIDAGVVAAMMQDPPH